MTFCVSASWNSQFEFILSSLSLMTGDSVQYPGANVTRESDDTRED